jgi:membrane protease YdiL (CAAX protease family)
MMAIAELLLAIAIMFAGLEGYLPFTSTPYLLAVGAAFLWWRGPGWRAIGLRRPERWGRALAVGAGLSTYQFASLYVVEPLVARLTTGELPDVSMFATLAGDEIQLVFWLVISWTLAAFMEEMVYRGWLTARIAELAGLSRAAWVIGILATSVLFGLAHLYQGTSGVITTGLSGLLFGAAYLTSGRNLWVAILAHGLTDTIGFVMIYLGVYPGV